MGEDFVGLLPFLQNVPLAVIAAILYRLWTSAVKELRVERKDHSQTQLELDRERDSRRKVEDEVAELTREVRGLKAEVRQLRTQVGEIT